jgi:hypothetical protein
VNSVKKAVNLTLKQYLKFEGVLNRESIVCSNLLWHQKHIAQLPTISDPCEINIIRYYHMQKFQNTKFYQLFTIENESLEPRIHLVIKNACYKLRNNLSSIVHLQYIKNLYSRNCFADLREQTKIT